MESTLRRRHQLFEFCDQPWLPDIIQTYLMRYLLTIHRISKLHTVWQAFLLKIIAAAKVKRIVDIGSGAGGPCRLIADDFAATGRSGVDFVFTDLRPPPAVVRHVNVEAPRRGRKYYPLSVDATDIPPELDGLRTMFCSFHHLRPETAKEVLMDAFQRRQPICVFEATENSAVALLSAIGIPLFVFLATPFIRPLSLGQVVLTYIVPVLPLIILWDGVVSHLRTYSPEEMRELVEDLSAADFEWDAGTAKLPGLPHGAPYLMGIPRESA